ncbi:MAG: N-acetylmuramoyl-L-alanine amidase [Thermonemataceae bacterium]|nr:N-acetylmuramoyl-L-alanine amidase [Thermonemataceae bacterium]
MLTRNGDVTRRQQRFTWRLNKAAKSDLFISLHMGYFADTSLRGLQVIYFSGIITSDNLADNLKYGQKSKMSDFSAEKLEKQSKNSKALAEKILDSVNVLPDLQRGSLKGENHNVLRNFDGVASVIIEMGVIGNADDRNVLLNDAETLASEIANGIVAYITNYKNGE